MKSDLSNTYNTILQKLENVLGILEICRNDFSYILCLIEKHPTPKLKKEQ